MAGRPPPQTGLASTVARRAQRRAIRFLVFVQACSGLGVATGVTLGALAGAAISGSNTIGGLAATASTVGVAASAMPVARVAARFGRRPALTLGFACGALGSLTAAIAVWTRHWPLLLVGMLLFGWSSTAGYATRYAATDLAEPSRRASQLALVVWPATIGVVLGPNLVDSVQGASRLVGVADLAGPFIFAAMAFATAAGLVLVGLRPDPLLLARTLAPPSPGRDGAPRARSWLPVGSLRGSSQVRWALTGVALNHAAMIAIMVMTPPDMRGQGSPLSAIGMVVSGHLAGMYVLSPAFGWLADRIGALRGLAAGTAMTAAAAAIVLAGSAGRPALTAAGLFVLGLGWSSSVVAGSSLLTEHALLDERTAAQGLSDLTMDVLGATAAAASGIVVSVASFGVLAGAVAGLSLLLLAAMAPAARRPPRIAGLVRPSSVRR